MPNTIEAAEMIEENTKRLRKNLNELKSVLQTFELDGEEDLTSLRANIQLTKDIIAQNEETAEYIRNTAN